MKTSLLKTKPAIRGSISTGLVIVLSIIVCGTILLVYEWHDAHPEKMHEGASNNQHHHKKHEAKPIASN